MVNLARRKQLRQAGRRGWSLISLIGALTISAMVLGVCVPFYLSSHRLVERNAGQMRAREMARELTSRIREDVRGARTTTVAADGRALSLALSGSRAGAATVRYAWSGAGLVREVRGAGGQLSERMVHAEPLRKAQFRRVESSVTAVLEFSAPTGIPEKPLCVETTVTSRVGP